MASAQRSNSLSLQKRFLGAESGNLKQPFGTAMGGHGLPFKALFSASESI